MANKTLLMMYKKYGLKELCYRLRKKPYEIYMTERKTHPSECGWDVSDH